MLSRGVDASASLPLFRDVGLLPDDDAMSTDGARLLAAHLLERNLLRLGRAGSLVERRLGPALQRLASGRLYRILGYVRLGDYLTERLGISLRRAQSILRLERLVETLPCLGAALRAGDMSLSKIETLADVATAATETLWLDRARRLTVAELREAVRRARAGDESAASSVTSISPHTGSAPAGSTAFPLSNDSIEQVESIEQDEPGLLVQFAAPASVFAVWHWALDLVRRVAGRQEPAWRCAEYLAAEFLSGVPGIPEEATGATTSGVAEGRPDRKEREAAAAREQSATAIELRADSQRSGEAVWEDACETVRQALASIGAGAEVESILSGSSTQMDPESAASGEQTDAFELDALLRRLVRMRQSLAWRQGRLLAALATMRLHRELGFGSLDEWIADRLPMSPRRARYLISLDRRLRPLPLLADAYRRGLVSWCQARLLVRVVVPATQDRWIRFACRVTVRRLEDAVVACELESPGPAPALGTSVPAHVGAGPLPPVDPSGEPSPGDVDRIAALSALLHTAASDGSDVMAIGISPLHTSASANRRSWRRIAFWAPLDVATLWNGALRACRAAAGPQLEDWECFLHFVRALRETWENPDDPQWSRRYRIFERDGWRCMAPGCTSRSALNEHHIVYRSHQGNDEDVNLVTLCIGHHQQGVHAGHVRCSGRAPDALWWELGLRPGGEPLLRTFGERIVTGSPRPWAPSSPCASSRPCAPSPRCAPSRPHAGAA